MKASKECVSKLWNVEHALDARNVYVTVF